MVHDKTVVGKCQDGCQLVIGDDVSDWIGYCATTAFGISEGMAESKKHSMLGIVGCMKVDV